MLLLQRRALQVRKPARKPKKPLICRPVPATTPHAGYGACTKCNCRGYEGSAYTCANGGCGHAYGDHW